MKMVAKITFSPFDRQLAFHFDGIASGVGFEFRCHDKACCNDGGTSSVWPFLTVNGFLASTTFLANLAQRPDQWR